MLKHFVKRHGKVFETVLFPVLMSAVLLSAGCDRKSEGEELILYPADGEVLSTDTEDDALSKEAAADGSGDSGVSGGDKTEEIAYVHVCGAVVKEGVYILTPGSRVVDAVAAAGGLTEDADSSYVNLALPVSDGMKIRIPTVAETAAGIIPETEGADPSGSGIHGENTGSSLVNINTATESELCTLPGIGSARARSIIEYRESSGGFSRIEDIMNVSGIKDKAFAKIKDLITV